MKTFIAILFKIITYLFLGLSIVLTIITIFRPEWIKIGIEYIGELIQTLGEWNYIIAFTSALIESLPIIGVLVPGMNIMILVGGFWGKTHFISTIIMASLGAMLGNYFGYLIGKNYGKFLIENYGDLIGIGKTEQKILENQIKKNGFWYIVLGKFHGTLRAFIPFIAAIGKMREKRFWLYNGIGSIIWAISMNLIGVFFIDYYETILDHIGKIMTGIMLIIILYLFLFKKESLKKYWNEKNAEMIEKYQQTSNSQKKPETTKKQIWETQYEDIFIRVENEWKWNGFIKEKILLDNTIMYEYSGNIQTLGLYKEFLYKNKKIAIKLGSKWHLMGVACQIFINDKYIFGDRIIMFPGKKQ